jgi:hypothetical protein
MRFCEYVLNTWIQEISWSLSPLAFITSRQPATFRQTQSIFTGHTTFDVCYVTLQRPLSLANWLNIDLFIESLYYATKLLTALKLI